MLGRMLGAARLNVQTYEDVESDGSATIQALLIVILVSAAAFVGGLFVDGDVDVVRALIIGVVSGVARWVLWALFTWMIGATLLKTDQTDANWGQLARCAGFAQTPGIFNVLVFIPIVGIIVYIVTALWSFVAMIIAVRQALDYTSTLRAFFVILIAAIPVYVLTGIIVAIIAGGGSDNGDSAFLVNQAFQVFTA